MQRLDMCHKNINRTQSYLPTLWLFGYMLKNLILFVQIGYQRYKALGIILNIFKICKNVTMRNFYDWRVVQIKMFSLEHRPQ